MGKRKHKKINSILIATFSPWKNNIRASTNGMIEPLFYYFLPKVKKLSLVDQPYPGSDKLFPIIENYSGVNLISKNKLWKTSFFLYPFLLLENKPGTRFSFKIRDFLSAVEAGILSKDKFDIYIGLEAINAIAGIILRKIGIVEKVCYYVSDYSPNRFKNKLVNSVYLWLDRIAAKNADFIWDVSLAMQPARISAGLSPQQSAPVIYVPNALFKEQLLFVPSEKREKNSICFVGTLGLENGPDLAIEAMCDVVKKIPDAKLHIIGGGGQGFEKEYLEKLVKKHKLEKNVQFYGFISDVKKISNIIKNFQLAVAPYKMIPGSHRLYGDATKIRQYLGAGLPVITTSVPPLGKEAEKIGAALVIKDRKKELAQAIISLLKDGEKIQKMTESARKFALHNTWDNTYSKALKIMDF